MQEKITPCLWFDDQAEEAAKFYTSIFEGSKIQGITRYSGEAAEAAGRPEGSVLTVKFLLAGQEFLALNGGPVFQFTEAVSFSVSCETQDEIDHYWEKLSEGGDEKAQQCGWLKDKYGLSWQVVPTELSGMLQDKDAAKSQRVMSALLQMKKLDLHALRQAYNQP